MVVSTHQQTGNVRNGKAKKRHRTAIGCSHGRQQSRRQQQPIAHAHDVNSKALGIALAKQQGVERLDKQYG